MTPALKQTLIETARQETGEIASEAEPSRGLAEPRARWPCYANIILGAWLLASPFALGYAKTLMMWSDLISGALIIILASAAVRTGRVWAYWALSFAGLWLLFAPLVFWTANAAAYSTGTLIGTLVIAFAILLPNSPGEDQATGPDVPPGWSYNPSAWMQRAPVIAMALVGFFIARYLAAYQLGHIETVWDPFFRDGTRQILESDVSRAFPISDAGLGAIAYLVEVLTGFVGGTRRWRTMPWMVILFGILVVPLGVVSIVLVVLQPLAVGAWCTLCLVTAFAMLIMISPAADEVIATIQFLQQSRREGKPFWPTFWRGATLEAAWQRFWKGGTVEMQGPAPSAGSSPAAGLWGPLGMPHPPWTLFVATALGIGLMFAPAVFQTQGAAANSDHLVGALVVTFSVIALGEVGRSVRWLNVLFGAWLLASPWFLSGTVPASQWSNTLAGGVLIALSIPRGRIRDQYGSFNRLII